MKLVTFLIAIASLCALASCNTIKGVGQDVQKAGSAIERSVK